MKIKNIKINGYGKLNNKEINLKDNINIIYGKNEAGKSTLLNFIKSIFYGIDKNKNGKNISDYDKYLPWETENFSGKISYKLDNGNEFEVYRDFKKKNPIIYNKNKQDISLNYPIDKNKGIDFINNQINIDKETFENTVIVGQNDIKIGKNAQNELIQKISNIVSSGDENVSYKKTMDNINKRQLEDIGTERTKEKPLNILNEKLEKLKIAREKVNSYKNFVKENDNDVSDIQKKIDNEEIKLQLYRVLKESNEKSKIKNSEIDVIKNICDEYFNKIEELDSEIDKDGKDKIEKEKRFSIIYYILFLLFIIGAIVCFSLKIDKIISFSLVIISLGVLVFDIFSEIKFNKNKKIKIKEIEEVESKKEQEITILRNNIKSRQAEIDMKLEEIKEAENEVNRLVMNNFEDKLDSDFIERAFELESSEIDEKIAEVNETINTLKIEKGAKQNQKEAMLEEINNLSLIQENINELEEEKRDLLSLNNSYNLAKEGLENAYENIRSNLSPEFTSRLSEIINKVSNGKYQEINFIDTDGLIVKVEDGRFLSVDRLSQGTIDQMYLGLRLASIETISNEKIPIILDETFAFFDDDRLRNILEFINNNYKDIQIVILTCSNREIEILNKLNIEYNYVSLEK